MGEGPVLGVNDIERKVGLLPEPDPDVYLTAAYNPTHELAPKSMSAAVNGPEHPPNPILAEAWERFTKPITEIRLVTDDNRGP